MTFTNKRATAAAAALMVGSLILTACSSADKGGSEGGSKGESKYQMTDAKGELKGEGASSQQNAMELSFIHI